MWGPDASKLVKVCLHSQGAFVETPWAENLGVAPGPPGARLVRLGNVPFLRPKPTYGDVLVVEPDATYGNKLTWNAGGVPLEQIRTRIQEDGGRGLVILDYTLLPSVVDAQAAFKALHQAGGSLNIPVEGYYAPKKDRPGRAYLAVPYELAPDAVLRQLRAQNLPIVLTLVHPAQ